MSNVLTLREIKRLRNLNIGFGVVHAGAAVGIGIIIGVLKRSNISTDLYRLISKTDASKTDASNTDASNTDASNTDTNKKITFESSKVVSVRLEWLVFSYFGITAIAHFVYAANVKGSYVRSIENGSNVLRWIEYSISSSLMIFTVAALSGIRDVDTLATIVVSNVMIMIQGAAIERLLASDSKTVELVIPFTTAWGLFSVTWIVIIISFFRRINESKSAGNKVPSWIYGVIIPTFLFFASFGIINLVQIISKRSKKNKKPYRYETYELTYILFSLFSKLFLGLFVAVGLIQGQRQ